MIKTRSSNSFSACVLGALTLFASLSATSTQAGTFSLTLVDQEGSPFKGAIVSLLPTSPGAEKLSASMPLRKSVMVQRDKQFDPHIVAVQKGGMVDFPNEDGIKHQVYSLSEKLQFDLLVGQGETKTGPAMNASGVVSLGCNIHDWMQAYVYVTDTPWFATTDDTGSVTLNLPDNEHFRWEIWHPRFSESEQGLSGDIVIPGDKMLVTLKQTLLPDYNETEDFDDFDDY